MLGWAGGWKLGGRNWAFRDLQAFHQDSGLTVPSTPCLDPLGTELKGLRSKEGQWVLGRVHILCTLSLENHLILLSKSVIPNPVDEVELTLCHNTTRPEVIMMMPHDLTLRIGIL
jgi:hypothetical protein